MSSSSSSSSTKPAPKTAAEQARADEEKAQEQARKAEQASHKAAGSYEKTAEERAKAEAEMLSRHDELILEQQAANLAYNETVVEAPPALNEEEGPPPQHRDTPSGQTDPKDTPAEQEKRAEAERKAAEKKA